MKYETSNEDHDFMIVDFDGRKSEPFTPLLPAAQEQLEKIRARYRRAKQLSEQAATGNDSSSKGD